MSVGNSAGLTTSSGEENILDVVPEEYAEGWVDGRVIMADEILGRLLELFGENTNYGTHWEDCYKTHPYCALAAVRSVVQSVALPSALDDSAEPSTGGGV